LQKLGEQLVALSSEQLKRIDVSDDLRNAVIVAGKTKSHGARRRQLQYIGTLMRDIDPEKSKNCLEMKEIINSYLSKCKTVIIRGTLGEAGMSLYKTEGNDMGRACGDGLAGRTLIC